MGLKTEERYKLDIRIFGKIFRTREPNMNHGHHHHHHGGGGGHHHPHHGHHHGHHRGGGRGGRGGGGGGLLPNPHLQLDYDRRRKVAMKCLELEEMLMNQG